MNQVEKIISTLEISKKLDKEILKAIEEILDNAPVGPWDYETFNLLKNRRNDLLDIDYIKNPDFFK